MKWIAAIVLVLALASHRADACGSGSSNTLPNSVLAAGAVDLAVSVGFTIGDVVERDHGRGYAVAETVLAIPGTAVWTVATVALHDTYGDFYSNGELLAAGYAALHLGLMVHGIYTLATYREHADLPYTGPPGMFHVGPVNASLVALPNGIGFDGTF